MPTPGLLLSGVTEDAFTGGGAGDRLWRLAHDVTFRNTEVVFWCIVGLE